MTDRQKGKATGRTDSAEYSESLSLSSLPAVPDTAPVEFVPDADGTLSVFLKGDDLTGSARTLTVIGGLRYSYRVVKVTAKTGNVTTLFLVS